MYQLFVFLLLAYTVQLLKASPFEKSQADTLNIRSITDDVQVLQGTTIELECEAAGTPPPSIRWMRNNQIINETVPLLFKDVTNIDEQQLAAKKQGAYINMATTGSRLRIPCASVRDSAVYTCVAQSPTKMDKADVRVDVMPAMISSKRTISCASYNGGALEPVVYMWSEGRPATIGFPVQLFCRAYGYPTPKISWKTPDAGWVDASNEQYQLLDSGDLLIKKLQESHHRAQFTCRASNEHGRDHVETAVYALSFKEPIQFI